MDTINYVIKVGLYKSVSLIYQLSTVVTGYCMFRCLVQQA